MLFVFAVVYGIMAYTHRETIPERNLFLVLWAITFTGHYVISELRGKS